MKNLATALVKAQREFGPALKSSTNLGFKTNGKASRYADLASCVEAVIGALNNNGIALIQKNYDCNNGVMVETMFVHESGEMLECGILHVPANKQDAHGYGSALTYARRYSLMAACGIAPEDDDGNSASGKVTPAIDGNALVDHFAAIEASSTEDELKAAFKAALVACKGNPEMQLKVSAAKDKAKAKL